MTHEGLCSICSHDDRAAIDAALVNGKPMREIARTFGIGSGVRGTDTFKPDHKKVAKHRDRCMGEAYVAAVQERKIEAGNALVDRMIELDRAVDESLARLRAGTVLEDKNGPMLNPDGSPRKFWVERDLLAAVREARRNVEMHARLAGSLPEGEADAVEQARALLGKPAARRMVQDLEAFLAAQGGGLE